jgi:small subunit ribosomal protein S3
MGQKVNPISLRLGYIKGWDSNWYGGKNFSDKLVEDDMIRKFVEKRIPNPKSGVSKIIIERTLKRLILTINTARPGVVIGKQGQEVDKMKEELKKLTNKDVQINIFEIKRPELDAKLVGDSIAQQLQSRVSYRRAMKQAIQNTLRVGALGIKVKVSGRLGGAEIARSEGYREGRVPLHTLRANVDYAICEAQTVYGKIGIKVWIFKGEIYGKPDLSPNANLDKRLTSSANEESRRPEQKSAFKRDRDDSGNSGGDNNRRPGGNNNRRPGGNNSNNRRTGGNNSNNRSR